MINVSKLRQLQAAHNEEARLKREKDEQTRCDQLYNRVMPSLQAQCEYAIRIGNKYSDVYIDSVDVAYNDSNGFVLSGAAKYLAEAIDNTGLTTRVVRRSDNHDEYLLRIRWD